MAKQQMSLLEAHELLADRYFKKGDYQHAYKEYNSLTQMNPYRSLYYRRTADCLLKMNDLPRALHFFERSGEYGEESFYAHFRAGEICMIKNDFERAIVHFQKSQQNASKEEKEKALIKIYQALSYLNRPNEGKEIEAYFQRINKNQPIPVPPRSNTYKDYIPVQVKNQVEEAQRLISSKDLERAIALLSSTLETKETPLVFRLLGEAYYKNGEYEKSQQCFQKAYSEFKYDITFLSAFFMADMATHRLDRARQTLEQMKKTDPSFPGIMQFQMVLNTSNSTSSNAGLPVSK